jgi:hypothetical protein
MTICDCQRIYLTERLHHISHTRGSFQLFDFQNPSEKRNRFESLLFWFIITIIDWQNQKGFKNLKIPQAVDLF